MPTIDIRTTQNVTIEYELASLRERVLAFLIDFLIVGVSYFILFLTLLSAVGEALLESMMTGYVVYLLLPVGCFILYELLSEVLANGQSWGKRSMGLRVVRLDGREPGLSDYLLRAIFHIIDTITSGGVLAALLISTSGKRQRLGDMTANTTVIRVRHSRRFRLDDILRINTLEDYQPRYPAVRRLSEEDMLLVKSVVSRYQTYRNAAHREAVEELVGLLRRQLDIEEVPADKIAFLKTLIRDYIVLTR